jgi:molecular chaperone DnaJ
MIDPYEILGIDINADQAEIKQAYRKAAKKHHPDLNQGDENAAFRFKEVQNAYDILKNPSKKFIYDKKKRPFSQKQKHQKSKEKDFSGFKCDDYVFEEYFGQSKFRGNSLKLKLEISLKEVYSGCVKYLKIKKRNPCFSCRGEGMLDYKTCNACGGAGKLKTFDMPNEPLHICKSCKGLGKYGSIKCDDCNGTAFCGETEQIVEIKIPPWVHSGQQIRLEGQGEKSIRPNGACGDIVVFIILKEDSRFTLKNQDIFRQLPVTYTQLIFGDEVYVNGVDEKFKITIPKYSQSGTKFIFKGKGLFSFDKKRGDFIVVLQLDTPSELTEEYQNALLKISDLEKKYLSEKIKKWQKEEQNE